MIMFNVLGLGLDLQQLLALKILVQLLPKPKNSEQTSKVLEHFTKLEESDPKDPKSQCNHCKKSFSCYPKSHNTSSMLQHLKNTCKKYLNRFDKSQSKLSFDARNE
jgi:hypothetical protein